MAKKDEGEWTMPVHNPQEPSIYYGPLPWDFPTMEEFEQANDEFWESQDTHKRDKSQKEPPSRISENWIRVTCECDFCKRLADTEL